MVGVPLPLGDKALVHTMAASSTKMAGFGSPSALFIFGLLRGF
jgi:hypothetical protein